MAATKSFLLLLFLEEYCYLLIAENVALGKNATQYGTSSQQIAILAVDGNRGQDGSKGECAISNSYDRSFYTPGDQVKPAWWTVHLGSTNPDEKFYIQWVRIYNRLDMFRGNIVNSIIKVGDYAVESSQPECSRIDKVEDVIYKQCNPVYAVKYLSIVSTNQVSLHLCEVEVEGYSDQVFQNMFEAPTVPEIRQNTVLIRINHPQQASSSYLVLYTAMSGDTNEHYGNRTSTGQMQVIEQHNLAKGRKYSIRLLSFMRVAEQERAVGISMEIIIYIPSDEEFLQMRDAPKRDSVGSTTITVTFQSVPGTWYYKVEVHRGDSLIKSMDIVERPGEQQYTATIDGLSPSTTYKLDITPYSSQNQIIVRGISSPPLHFATLSEQSPLPTDMSRTTQKLSRPTSVLSTLADVGTPKTTSESSGGQPESGPMDAQSWVVPVAAGVSGGVIGIIAITLLIILCVRKRRKKTGDTADVAFSGESTKYDEVNEAVHPEYYAHTLPRSSGISINESQRSHLGPVAGANHREEPIPQPEPSPTEDENKLHEDLDMLYAQINKAQKTSQKG